MTLTRRQAFFSLLGLGAARPTPTPEREPTIAEIEERLQYLHGVNLLRLRYDHSVDLLDLQNRVDKVHFRYMESLLQVENRYARQLRDVEYRMLKVWDATTRELDAKVQQNYLRQIDTLMER
mgnify:CR=1 FL=1|jgi:hypothetical protein